MKSTSRKMRNQRVNLSISQILGVILVAVGILLMVSRGSFMGNDSPDAKAISSVITIGFLVAVFGTTIFFPDMLRSGSLGAISFIRVAIFMAVVVSAFVCVNWMVL